MDDKSHNFTTVVLGIVALFFLIQNTVMFLIVFVISVALTVITMLIVKALEDRQ